MPELFVGFECEELPARFVRPAMAGLAANLQKILGPLAPHVPHTWGTPRRIAVAFAGCDPRRALTERLVTGPPVAQAFVEGRPGPIAEAFARKQGLGVERIERVVTPKGEVVAIRKMEGGESLAAVVAAGLHDAILGIQLPKTMRWSNLPWRFARPVHHIFAVIDGEPILGEALGLTIEGTAHGHPLAAPGAFPVEGAEAWASALRGHKVIADRAERRDVVRRMVLERAEMLGDTVVIDEGLLDEVTDLVEYPVVIDGVFDPHLLDLPERLLVESMKVNQRYFPLYRAGTLCPRFIVVSNNPFGDRNLIAAGNARVLAARFHDAKFFYAEDRKQSLAEHGKKLAGMTWIRGLGTMAERQAAVAVAAEALASLLGADPARTRAAAEVCKCDLATAMVGEFPELQGHVGRLLAGDLPSALAIEEAYLPRFAGDATPSTAEGAALALAERLTLLGAAFANGMQPTGSADPQGLRRAANGIVAIVLARGWRGDLARLFAAVGVVSAEVVEFTLARLRATLLAEGNATDLVDAVVATGGADLVSIAERVRAISVLSRNGSFAPIRVAFRRAAGLVREHPSTAFDPGLFEHPAERTLAARLASVPAHADVAGTLAALSALRPALDELFSAVLVMCEDPALRANRLGLLSAVTARFSGLADFTRLSTE